MNQSRGTLYFHRLFSVQELGFGKNPEPFIAALIRQFLRIGEAAAGRWIEMPQAILLFQMVPGVPDSGAIYLYDRRQHVFYMLCFDGPDDHLTLEEFEQILAEYNLIHFAEQPGLIDLQGAVPIVPSAQAVASLVEQQPAPNPAQPQPENISPLQLFALDLTVDDYPRLPVMQDEWYLAPSLKHAWFQTVGTA